jgi:hypothetical protein
VCNDPPVSSDNGMCKAGGIAIVKALEKNTTLQSLKINSEFFCSAPCGVSQFRDDVLYCDERGLLFQFALFCSGCRLCFSFEGRSGGCVD